MNAKQDRQSDPSIEQLLNSIPMSEYERDAALRAARIGAALADAVVWVCSKFRRPDAPVFAAPSPKH
jgi:hypothetical protein